MVRIQLIDQGLSEFHCEETIEAAAAVINFRKRLFNASISALGAVIFILGVYFFFKLNPRHVGVELQDIAEEQLRPMILLPAQIGMGGLLAVIFGLYRLINDKV